MPKNEVSNYFTSKLTKGVIKTKIIRKKILVTTSTQSNAEFLNMANINKCMQICLRLTTNPENKKFQCNGKEKQSNVEGIWYENYIKTTNCLEKEIFFFFFLINFF